jgi:hypothetical protein
MQGKAKVAHSFDNSPGGEKKGTQVGYAHQRAVR